MLIVPFYGSQLLRFVKGSTVQSKRRHDLIVSDVHNRLLFIKTISFTLLFSNEAINEDDDKSSAVYRWNFGRSQSALITQNNVSSAVRGDVGKIWKLRYDR